MDVETQRAITEVWDLWPKYIPIDDVVVPKRLLCFAAKWHGKDKVYFHAAWDDDDIDAHKKMIRAAWKLLDAADIVVGWNSARFDEQHFQAAFGRLELGPPSPFRSLDLMKVAKRNFASGEMSLKLDWFSREWLGDRKLSHSATDIWRDIRYGNREERRAAQRVMQDYNRKDVILTERLFDRFKPWTGINYAIYDQADDSGQPRCTNCGSFDVEKRGFFYTTTFRYQRYHCPKKRGGCGSWSKGKRMVYTTELRPV